MPDSSPSDNGIAASSAAAVDPAAVRVAAMNLLARREHSLRELRDKLLRRFPDELVIQQQLARLAAEQLQSDARFAQSYIHHRSTKGYGPVRVKGELRERGVQEADIQAAMAAQDIDWCALAADVLRKKFGNSPAIELKEQAKRAQFMQYRGFTTEHYQRLWPS